MSGVYGVIGEHLGHSRSPQLHACFGDYPYRIFELPPEKVGEFLQTVDYDGLNVTIPYKTTVIPYLDELDASAASVGAVNTIVRKNGKLTGFNTDLYGFSVLLDTAGLDVSGAKTLVLGSGGASKAVTAVLRERGASVTVISRSGEDNYGNLSRHRDAVYLVNTTPVGMYPRPDASPVDLTVFPNLKGVADVVYNPTRTRLLQQAASLGIPHIGGMVMLTAQAVRASELFTGKALDRAVIGDVTQKMIFDMSDVLLIGMPGCGKSTVGRLLADRLSLPFVDLDDVIAENAGKSIPDIFGSEGEDGFRRRESAALAAETGRHRVIACGGGVVTRPENLPVMKAAGVLLRLTRPQELLATDGRPLSQGDLAELAARREPLYRRFADVTVGNDGAPEDCAESAVKALTDWRWFS